VGDKNIKALYNWLSLTGFIVTANSMILILILYLNSVLSVQTNAYLNLYIYLILPVFLALGLLLIPIGVLLNIRKRKAANLQNEPWPVIDLNNRQDWAIVVRIFIITTIFLATTAMGSYHAFEYTQSNEFCGKLCHKVEEPEYITYLHSPHARVTCVGCHVGQGTHWYIKSKLAVLYQVYSVIFNTYPRPIPTPIHNLRPERETCEGCHWPEKFYSRKLRVQRSYLADSANTEWNLSLLMKIGPESKSIGNSESIHWHINKNFRIEYVSVTRNRESIPWVKLTNLKTGEVKIFNDEENPLDAKIRDTLDKHTMDCMDCHNRASHQFKSAPDYIDNAFVTGLLPKNLPFFKEAAMKALKMPFQDKDIAMHDIRESILNYYSEKHPEVLKSDKQRLIAAIAVIREEYNLNAFPFMRADASKYPNHIGHLESKGCFRCHSDRHKTAKGETISRNCEICHTIIAQGPTGNINYAYINSMLQFEHPTSIGEKWKTKFCSECHKDLY
jgi:nitrate/TMAO reductase-like tetraheme cytochrome c subunit